MKTALADWCGAFSSAVIVTDEGQRVLAEAMDLPNCRIIPFGDDCLRTLQELRPDDLAVLLLSLDTFTRSGASRVFSPFAKPEGVLAKVAFIRLGITKKSLIEGLSTPKELVYGKLAEMDGLSGRLRVTSAAGTDITLMAERFETCRHEIADAGGLAFLPPSETSARVRGADGTIVVDVTVGQLYHYGELLEEFGLVRNPVILTVENGFVSGITGGETAALLREKLFALPAGCRELVELGQGLSKMTPTGVIGVDESIIDTCHFGFGDGGTCGTHLDVVIGSPVIAMA